MHDQAKLEPLEQSTFFADGAASRMPVEGTVARGHLRADEAFYSGFDSDDQLLAELPMPLERSLLERGQERYGIFCAPCHGAAGDGNGMVVRRGYKRPASFHIARLRGEPVGYYYDVITRGFGQMPSYASQVKPEDRWAIAAYVRALQISQGTDPALLGSQDQAALADPPMEGEPGDSHPAAQSHDDHSTAPRDGNGEETEGAAHD